MAVLRESAGSNEPQETLQPYGTLRALMPDGTEVAIEPSWFRYVGDMHIRLVFDSRTLYLFHDGHWSVFQQPLAVDDVSTAP